MEYYYVIWFNFIYIVANEQIYIFHYNFTVNNSKSITILLKPFRKALQFTETILKRITNLLKPFRNLTISTVYINNIYIYNGLI